MPAPSHLPAPSALSAKLDLAAALREVLASGAAFRAGALDEGFRRGLAREAAGVGFEAMSAYEGRAEQEGEIRVLTGGIGEHPHVRRLRDELVRGVADVRGDAGDAGRDPPAGLDQWRPNEVAVQRYPAGALGITPHLDSKRYTCLVAVFTAAGSAPFVHCRDRAGEALARWQAGPGSLVLMRGPGLDGDPDGRPLHAVSGPETGERISVTFRMDSRRPGAA